MANFSSESRMPNDDIRLDPENFDAKADSSITPTRIVFNLHQEITKAIGISDNHVWSPYGINILLGIVYAGAGGKTAEEMKTVLGWGGVTYADLFQNFQKTMTYFRSAKEILLSVASRGFADENHFAIEENYTRQLNLDFAADLKLVNFENPAPAAKIINDWVKEQTRDKIQTIIDSDSIKPGITKLVLVNAIYFKAKWKTPFSTHATRDGPFYTDSSKKEHITIPFMSERDHWKYGNLDELNAEAVQLPYQGDKFSMVALLPHESSGIAQLEKKLAQGFNLRSLPSFLENRDIRLQFPKFRIESQIPLKENLQNLGLEKIFTEQADLSRISPGTKLFVSEVVQKAFIDITEDGTEAAAASQCMGEYYCMPMYLTFNRPFIGYIFDEETNTILFMYRKVK